MDKFFFDWEKGIIYNYKTLYEEGGDKKRDPWAPIIPEQFNWLAMVDRLANGDITKHDSIYEQNWISCLNLLAYYKARDKYIEYQNKMMKYGK